MSVVVVTARDAPRLVRCLTAVLREAGPIALELVVVLNAAEPGLRAALERDVAQARLVVSQIPLGFGAAVNLGARHARGDLLHVLHDDTLVAPGWLSELVAALDEHPRAGAAGSLVVGHDGLVQTAGHVIWRDGRTQPPWHGERQVTAAVGTVEPADFCSSATLLVRREAWEATGGFDEEIHPVQYVDADLGMALRSRGWIVVCAPRSRVLHERGGTGSHALRTFAAQRNREGFVTKWAADLAHQAPFGDDPEALERARAATRSRAQAVLAEPAALPATTGHVTPGQGETDAERAERERRALLRDLEFKAAFVAWLEPMKTLADELWARLLAEQHAAAEREARLRAELDVLRARARTLDAIEAGGWWRLRARLLPLIRVAGRMRVLARREASRHGDAGAPPGLPLESPGHDRP